MLLAAGTGCQTYTGGMTLPSPRYLQHPPQYYPADPPFPLQRERDAMQEPVQSPPARTSFRGSADLSIRPATLPTAKSPVSAQTTPTPAPKTKPATPTPVTPEKPARRTFWSRFIGFWGK
jgi:hypothetical protein